MHNQQQPHHLPVTMPPLTSRVSSKTPLLFSAHTQRTWAGEQKPPDAPPAHGTVFSSSINLSACALGASMLSLPYTMKISGPIVALQFIVLFAVMAFVSSQAIVRAGLATRRSTYSGIVESLFGRNLSKVVDTLLSLTLMVAAISYIVGLIDLLPDMFHAMHHVSRTVRIVICVIVLFPVTLVGSLSSFGPASSLAVIGCFIFSLSLIFETVTTEVEWRVPPLETWVSVDMPGLIYSMPMLCFVYAFHYVEADTLCELYNPSPPRIRRMNFATILTLISCYLPVSICGYVLQSGGLKLPSGHVPNISTNILADFRPTSPSVIIAKWTIGLLLLFTYPLFIIPLRRKLEQLCFSGLSNAFADPKRITVAVGINCIVALAAILLPDLGIANALAGGCIAVIMLLFPGCFMVKLQLAEDPEDRSAKQMAVGALFICFGMVICFVGLFGSSLFDFV